MSIEQLVKGEFNGLSASQKKVAEYLLSHPDECALLTAKQISREAGVSETTVIRLSYALGFSNFSDMQKRLRERILKTNSAPQTLSLEASEVADEPMPLASLIENDIAILQVLLQQLNPADIWKAVDALIEADQVLVAGYRASYAAACWFSLSLGMTRGHVQLCQSAGDDYVKLAHLTERSVAVIISVPRYSREILNLANQAKEHNVKLIAVTDRLLSPVGRISDITLTTDVNIDSGMVSAASLISVLNLLVYGIKTKDSQRFQAKQQQLEQLYAASGIFIE
ncbi:MurR/RpiR family transcriptional regulator [Paenibacillus ginsengarvi]|uniref:MurR/RpiR family transcriptional regulator n=1 Tax=Paenibacillus ginsengarvi TaxID=400777 RepID=A0A3B0CDA5_9BACL|nr:MurR/RpiR family transcriptional regulator [Paenibacillus ginsengarvi]